MAKIWPSGAIATAEAGVFLGSHGMSSDSQMRTMSLINILWDGNSFTSDRRTKESVHVQNARLSIGLQIQESVLMDFMAKSGGIARGIGFISRMLLSFPVSTQGSRQYTQPPKEWPKLEAFQKKIKSILKLPLPMENGILKPEEMTLSPEAKELWIKCYNEIEQQMGPEGL